LNLRFGLNFKYRLWLVMAGLLLSFYGCAGPQRTTTTVLPSGPTTITPPITAPPLIHDVVHEVGPMETLWRIGKMYQVAPGVIMEVNHITDPAKIAIGQKLLIPDAHPLRPVISLYPTHRWTYIIIHHTSTEIGNARSIHDLHHQRNFWNGLGYHFLIDNGSLGKQNGQIEAGPRWIKQMDGAHCNVGGMNQRGIGVALVGNFSETPVSEPQFESLVYLVDTLRRYYNIPTTHILRHGSVPGKATECPGKNFPWRRFMARLNSLS
jgi:LysM repeat protein